MSDLPSSRTADRKQRSRRGCRTCRMRKVKCDELRGVCGNCSRLSLACRWDSDRNAPFSGATQRSRKYRACQRCREKKLKCLESENHPGCQECLRQNISCHLPVPLAARRQSSPFEPSVPAKSTYSGLPDSNRLRSLLNAYFQGPNNFSLAILHRPTFMAMLEKDIVPRNLLLIVLATSLRCLEPSSALPDQWAKECRDLIVPQIFEHMSTMNLQVLLLLQRYEWHRGSHLSSFFLSALAVKLAYALQLHLEPSDRPLTQGIVLPATVLETRRRLMWSCFIMDSIPDAGMRPHQSAVEPFSIQARLPCNETSYQQTSGLGVKQPTMTDLWADNKFANAGARTSISAYLIKMAVIRTKILRYVHSDSRSANKGDESSPWMADSDFHHLERKLHDFGSTLPADIQFDPDNDLSLTENLSSFFTMHAMFFATYTDLFRGGIQKGRQNEVLTPATRTAPDSFIELCRRGRLEKAFEIAKVVEQSQRCSAAEHDPFLAILSCLAIRILVAEGQNIQDNPLPISNATVLHVVNACKQCALKTARWSIPVRKLLLAVDKLVAAHGWSLNIPELIGSRSDNPSHQPSRQGSPSLHLYGTSGELAKNRAAEDLEAMQLPKPIIPKSRAPPATRVDHERESILTSNSGRLEPDRDMSHAYTAPSADLYLQSQPVVSPETLQMAANWDSGLYDWELAQLQFDQWADLDFGLAFSQEEVDPGLNELWFSSN